MRLWQRSLRLDLPWETIRPPPWRRGPPRFSRSNLAQSSLPRHCHLPAGGPAGQTPARPHQCKPRWRLAHRLRPFRWPAGYSREQQPPGSPCHARDPAPLCGRGRISASPSTVREALPTKPSRESACWPSYPERPLFMSCRKSARGWRAKSWDPLLCARSVHFAQGANRHSTGWGGGAARTMGAPFSRSVCTGNRENASAL